MTSIVDWFDPKNIEHLRAYNHLRNYGVWPLSFSVEFNDRDIEFVPSWQILLLGKIANEYINEKLLIKK